MSELVVINLNTLGAILKKSCHSWRCAKWAKWWAKCSMMIIWPIHKHWFVIISIEQSVLANKWIKSSVDLWEMCISSSIAALSLNRTVFLRKVWVNIHAIYWRDLLSYTVLLGLLQFRNLEHRLRTSAATNQMLSLFRVLLFLFLRKL